MEIFYKNLILRDVLHLTIFILKRYKNNIPFTLARQIFIIVKNKVRKNLSRLDKLQKVSYFQEHPQNSI